MKAELSNIKHERSVKQYPDIDLHKDEYVVLEMKRAKIGIAIIWAVVVICIVLLSIVIIGIASNKEATNTLFVINDAAMKYLWMIVFSFYAVICVGGFIGQTIYTSNRMYVTNKRIIQKIRMSLFANQTQIIELAKVEDVSFRQKGIMDHILKIGTLRMSTAGDETTYTFAMLETPRDEVDMISQLVYDVRRPAHASVEKASVTTPASPPAEEAPTAPTMPAPVKQKQK